VSDLPAAPQTVRAPDRLSELLTLDQTEAALPQLLWAEVPWTDHGTANVGPDPQDHM